MPLTATSATYSQAVGAELRRWREVQGLTQAECARRMDCSAAYWQSVEKGRANVTLGQLAKIADSIGAYPRFVLEPLSPLAQLDAALTANEIS